MDRKEGESNLTEGNIPGEKLTGVMDAYTIVQLRWWLPCWGIKVLNS